MCTEECVTTCTKKYKNLQFMVYLATAAASLSVVLQLIFQQWPLCCQSLKTVFAM